MNYNILINEIRFLIEERKSSLKIVDCISNAHQLLIREGKEITVDNIMRAAKGFVYRHSNTTTEKTPKVVNSLPLTVEVYDKAIDAVKGYVINHSLTIDYRDCVSDAYVKICESDNCLTEQSLISKAIQLTYRECQQPKLGDDKRDLDLKELTCKDCKELLPVALFKVYVNKFGKRILYKECDDCRKRATLARYYKNKDKINARLKEKYHKKSEEEKQTVKLQSKIRYEMKKKDPEQWRHLLDINKKSKHKTRKKLTPEERSTQYILAQNIIDSNRMHEKAHPPLL